MEDLDKKTIKALAADRRVEILKSLAKRRKLPSELSRSLGIAPSTVVEHLKVLEHAELVSKNPQGPKWIYYELTGKGKGIVQPETPFRFVLSLLGGGGMILLGTFQLLAGRSASFMGISSSASSNMASTLKTELAQDTPAVGGLAQNITQTPLLAPLDWIGIAFLATGLILLVLALKFKK